MYFKILQQTKTTVAVSKNSRNISSPNTCSVLAAVNISPASDPCRRRVRNRAARTTGSLLTIDTG